MIDKSRFACAGDAKPRPHGNCYWLAEDAVLAGPHPGPLGVDLLRSVGVTHFVDLTAAGESSQPYNAAPATYSRHPITDFGVPTVAGLQATLADIASHVAQGGLVYVHCRAGIGRTGTVAACLLVEQGFTGEEALALLKQKWQAVHKRVLSPNTPETEAQRQFVRKWAQLRSG